MKISIVISVFNEADNIRLLMEKLITFEIPDHKYEYIYVDDGSIDDSNKLISELAEKDPRVRLLAFTRNFGHEIAMSAGLDAAIGDAVIFMDADLQHPPESIPSFINEWRKGYKIVLGVRKRTYTTPFFYNVTTTIFYKILSWLANMKFTGNNPDFRLIDRYYVDELKKLGEHSRMFRGFVNWIGAENETARVDFEAPERTAGESKYNFKSLIDLGLDAIFAFSLAPMKLAIIFALTGLFFAVALGLYLYIPYLIEGHDVPGFLTVVFSVLIMGSAQLFILAVFAEYIGRIHFETKKRPLYVLRQNKKTKS